MSATILKYERFERPPVAVPKRLRGRLPRGVASIQSVQRLRVGVLAEVFDQERPEDNGKRVRITGFDPNNDGYHFACESLDGPIQCEGGSFATMIWFKPEERRQLWTGNTAPAKVGVI